MSVTRRGFLQGLAALLQVQPSSSVRAERGLDPAERRCRFFGEHPTRQSLWGVTMTLTRVAGPYRTTCGCFGSRSSSTRRPGGAFRAGYAAGGKIGQQYARRHLRSKLPCGK